MNSRWSIFFNAGVCLLFLVFCLELFAAVHPAYPEARSRLEQAGSIVTESNVTGHAQFIRFGGKPTRRADASPGRPPEDQLDEFFTEHGAIFGIGDHRNQFVIRQRRTTGVSGSQIKMQQIHMGIPVFGAVLKAHFDRNDALYAINGATLDGFPPGSDSWNISSIQAAEIAVRHTVRGSRDKNHSSADLLARQIRKIWYHDGLLKGISGQIHSAYEVLVTNGTNTIREWIYIDGFKGRVLNRITGIHTALDREVSESVLSNVIWDESGGDPDPIPNTWPSLPAPPGTDQQRSDWQNELDGTREIYNLFLSMTSGVYLSYDGADATMRTVNDLSDFNCAIDPNANWNGESANFCPNVTGDDTLAHEWGHAYTEYTGNLIYQWQSGALSESYSDIWGEVVDFLNSRDTDTPDVARATAVCSSNVAGNNVPGAPEVNTVRWLSGESDPAFNGAIGDLWYPECFNDPGTVSSGAYWCSSADSGGVHSNSGVPNRAFALMVDGDAGLGITSLGLTKSAHIHWAALNMLTPASNFVDQANALEASCLALIATNLPSLDPVDGSTGLSDEVIDENDCTEVATIVAAVELRDEPVQCGFQSLLESPAPALCEGLGEVETLFSEDWEAGVVPQGWTVGSREVANEATFDTPDWVVVSEIPDGASGQWAAFGADINAGDCALDDEAGVIWLRSPSMDIPLDAGIAHIAFDHSVATELGWDGANLKISVNGGQPSIVPAGHYTFNAYNEILHSADDFNTNPLAGEPAFSGTDEGLVAGAWGQSQVSLADLAGPGDSVELQFELGVDSCLGAVGWYLDDMRVYSCSEETGPGCGDGVFQEGEECDDGNTQAGDGCSEICAIESGYNCTLPVPGSITNHIEDTGFEAGPGAGFWTEFSTSFGTPICDIASCGIDWEANTGQYWAWFGGIGGVTETGSVAQDVVIPVAATTISFWSQASTCDLPGDFVELLIDDEQAWLMDGADASCFVTPYQQHSVDITPYTDGGIHSVEFHSITNSASVEQPSSFFIDDIGIIVTVESSPSNCSLSEEKIFSDSFE